MPAEKIRQYPGIPGKEEYPVHIGLKEHWDELASYTWYGNRENRAYQIECRRAPNVHEEWLERGWFVRAEATSQYLNPNEWTYLVYQETEDGPLKCNCPDYDQRLWDWAACKHIVAALRTVVGVVYAEKPETPQGLCVYGHAESGYWGLSWCDVPRARYYDLQQHPGRAHIDFTDAEVEAFEELFGEPFVEPVWYNWLKPQLTRVEFNTGFGAGTYGFRVRACNSVGCSEWSKPVWKDLNSVFDIHSHEDCPPCPGEELVLELDPGLERAIRETLEMPSGIITPEDLKDLTVLLADNYGIRSLWGLQHAENLEVLKVPNNSIPSIRPLEGLDNLEYLDLYNNDLSVLGNIETIVKLNYLDVRRNDLYSIFGIGELQNLEFLWISHNNIRLLEPIRRMRSLKSFRADHNVIGKYFDAPDWAVFLRLIIYKEKVGGIHPIRTCPFLDYVDLSHNEIMEIGPHDLPLDVETVNLADNQIRSLYNLLMETEYYEGVELDISSNPLNFPAINQVIPILEEAGMNVVRNEEALVALYDENPPKHTYRLIHENGKVYNWTYRADDIVDASVSMGAQLQGWRISVLADDHVFFENETPLADGRTAGFVINHPLGGRITAEVGDHTYIINEAPIEGVPIGPLEAPALNPIDNPEAEPVFVVTCEPVRGAEYYQFRARGHGLSEWNLSKWKDKRGIITSPVFRGRWHFQVRCRFRNNISDWSDEQTTDVRVPPRPRLHRIDNPEKEREFTVTGTDVPDALPEWFE